MNHEQIKALTKAAIEAGQAAYAPYSAFKVGAALLTACGEIITGCNVEIGGYASSCCAERVAIYKAVSGGKRAFAAVAIAGGPDSGLVADCFPCGVCRQVLAEFCGDDLIVIVAESGEKWREFTLGELFPHRFAENV